LKSIEQQLKSIEQGTGGDAVPARLSAAVERNRFAEMRSKRS